MGMSCRVRRKRPFHFEAGVNRRSEYRNRLQHQTQLPCYQHHLRASPDLDRSTAAPEQPNPENISFSYPRWPPLPEAQANVHPTTTPRASERIPHPYSPQPNT